MKTAPIVAIAAHPGGGKTSLTVALRDRLGAPALHYDDYERMTGQPPAKVREWIARGSDYDEIMLEPLVEKLQWLSRQEAGAGCVLLDTLLGRAHRETGKMIHTLIWIDTPPDIALARKIRTAAGKAVHGREADFTAWLATYLSHYEGFIADTYVIQRERVRPGADIVLDGRLPLDALVEEAMAAIAGRIDLSCGPRP